jgi:hypothetical protein
MQGQLMGADTGQFKGFGPSITLFGVVDCNDSLTLFVPARGDIKAAAIGRKYTVTDKVLAGWRFYTVFFGAGRCIENVKGPSWASLEKDGFTHARPVASAVAASLDRSLPENAAAAVECADAKTAIRQANGADIVVWLY